MLLSVLFIKVSAPRSWTCFPRLFFYLIIFSHLLCWFFFLCSPFKLWSSGELCGLLFLFHMLPQVIFSSTVSAAPGSPLDLGLSPSCTRYFKLLNEKLQFDDVSQKLKSQYYKLNPISVSLNLLYLNYFLPRILVTNPAIQSRHSLIKLFNRVYCLKKKSSNSLVWVYLAPLRPSISFPQLNSDFNRRY